MPQPYLNIGIIVLRKLLIAMKQILLRFSRLLLMMLALVLMGSNLYAQNLTIRGIVLDDANQPLPGVSVIAKGTGQGTATGVGGRFTISVIRARLWCSMPLVLPHRK